MERKTGTPKGFLRPERTALKLQNARRGRSASIPLQVSPGSIVGAAKCGLVLRWSVVGSASCPIEGQSGEEAAASGELGFLPGGGPRTVAGGFPGWPGWAPNPASCLRVCCRSLLPGCEVTEKGVFSQKRKGSDGCDGIVPIGWGVSRTLHGS